ncbi:hypothetical protein [Parachitinimonas caeni]|uniref:Uncharacterized protein n=1 Tax=Parachitinimonas caeni TaxID=3031301 RepID=A0ABT7E302_9NEIS|nr:hypothetical protein [Parachitinimonas caeni]MDK2126696.1 hypothetical protein [Parachitinimonas caeni]
MDPNHDGKLPSPDAKSSLSPRSMTYGDGQAIILLVAERMGLSPSHLEDAMRQLRREVIHPMTGAAIEKEAMRVSNSIRHDVSLVRLANDISNEFKAKFGFVPAPYMTGEQ